MADTGTTDIAWHLLSDEELAALREFGTERAVAAGDVLYEAGASDYAFYVVLEGEVASSEIVLSPSEAPYTEAARPAGPEPTTTRSTTEPGVAWYVIPRCSANSPGVGR